MARKTFVNRNGYRQFKGSRKLVHRWVEEKKLRRKLKHDEVVHHKDGNPLNNSLSNLRVYPNQSIHMK
ncbi:MAG: HNH endonuclease, partial [Treponema sp.]|nr:HNH endonuclease [Treponema sp.]